jgi:hypothetical protein
MASTTNQQFVANAADEPEQTLHQTLTYIVDKMNGLTNLHYKINGSNEVLNYKAALVSSELEITCVTEVESIESNGSKEYKGSVEIVTTINFSQLDPKTASCSDINNDNHFWLNMASNERARVIKIRRRELNGESSASLQAYATFYVENETVGKRLKNAFKHAIELSGGKALKPDPFDK